MLCLTLSTVGQNLGTTTTANAFVPNASYAVAYVVRAQPTECAADQYVLVTKQELQIFSPFQMDNDSAAAIGSAVLLAMAVAFVIRMARKLLESEKESDT